jgi:molecular chaperone GrpE
MHDTHDPHETRETRDDATDAQAEAAGDAAGADTAASEPSLEQRLAAAEDQAKRYHDSYLRAQAELQNVMRRHERELGERSRYEGESLIKDLLNVVDDLERALEHAGEPAAAGVGEGVRMVRDGLLAALERHGVTRVGRVGEPFDPAIHEAVALLETDEQEPNTVMAVHRAGYVLRDRLLRAAMVVVAKAPPGHEKSASQP